VPAASGELRRVLYIQAAMPSAVFPIILARHYGGDPATAVRVVVATSVLGLITIPLWLALLT
jgi:malate permease and related proteins